jgi:DNA polymerase-3 subunit alpha
MAAARVAESVASFFAAAAVLARAFMLISTVMLGDAPAGQIVKGRKDGPYKSFTDFLDRVDIKAVGKKVVELLVKTGAFDAFGISRETLAGNLERAVEYAQNRKEDKELGQSSLFEDSDESGFPDFEYEAFPAMDRAEKLNIEKQLIGFYFSGHPMDEYREMWQKTVKVDLGKPDNLKTGNCVLVGIIKSVKTITTGKGNTMAFATLADYNGEIEVTFFARTWEKCQGRVEAGKVAILRGKIEYQKDRERRGFIVDDWVSVQEVDAVIKETEEQERKWDAFRNTWTYMADLKSSGLAGAEKGSYTIVGFLKSLRKVKDKNGGDMAFGTLQDFEGDIDLVFFSRVWNECRDLLKLDEIVALKGSIDPENDRNPEKPGFKVSSIADIAQLSRSAARKASAGEEPPKAAVKSADEKTNPARGVHIRLSAGAMDRDEGLHPLRDFLAQNSGPFPVFIHVQLNGSERIIRTNTGLASTAENESLEVLKNCAGVTEVWRK